MDEILVLATSGLKPGQLEDEEHNNYPRVDYLELRKHLNLKIINYDIYNKTKWGRYLRYGEIQLRSDLYLTLLGLRAQKHYKAVFAMSERVGIPYAGFQKFFGKKNKLITMFQSWSWRQEFFISSLQLHKQMESIAVHCNSMKEKLIELKTAEEKITLVPYSKDEKYFSPVKNINPLKYQILAIGEPRTRNYPLLFNAVSTIPVKLVAATSGMWTAREKKPQINAKIPENVCIVRNLPLDQLRLLYSYSQFVILPVCEQISSAGLTGLLEAACMEKAVIATRSPGLKDFLVDGETGIFVEPNNVHDLREAILFLLAHPEIAHRMGKNARQRVEAFYNLDNYVVSLATFITRAL